MAGDIDKLRMLDKLILCNNETVKDLLEQAIVASEIVNESDKQYLDMGPLELMYTELKSVRTQVETLTMMMNKNNTYVSGETNPYQNVTWTDNTSGWGGNPHMDPTRNYPPGYVWNPLMGKVVLSGS
jgi:hypothetical protein